MRLFLLLLLIPACTNPLDVTIACEKLCAPKGVAGWESKVEEDGRAYTCKCKEAK